MERYSKTCYFSGQISFVSKNPLPLSMGSMSKKETMTVEGMIKIVYELLKDKLNIVKLTFSSGVNLASEEYEPHLEVDRCPLCGIALNEDGVCPKCGYKKP